MSELKPKRRAQQMATEERKQLLLKFAIQAFAEKGIDAAKHADIARAAKVSVPTVFSYFPSRQALVAEVLSTVGEFYFLMVKHSLEGKGQRDRLYASAQEMVNAVEQHPDYVKVWLMWSTHFGPEMQTLYQKFETKILDLLVEVIFCEDPKGRSLQDQQDNARLLLGAGAMLAQLVFRGEKRARQQKFIENIIEHFTL